VVKTGHTRLTHTYLLSRETQTECISCQCPLTVKGILLECTDLSDVRQKYFSVSSILFDLFDNVDVCNIVTFLNRLILTIDCNVVI